MSQALQLIPPADEGCLDLDLARSMVSYVSSLIKRDFTPDRTTRIAILFDSYVRAGEWGDHSIMAAIDLEMERYGDPIAKPAPTPPLRQTSFGLERLPRAEEAEVLAFAEASGVPLSELACNMTRQRGEGSASRRPDLEWKVINDQVVVIKQIPRSMRVTYDLLLCEYCGNLEPSARCPAKLRAIQERAEVQNQKERLTLPEA